MLDENGFIVQKKKHERTKLSMLIRALQPIDFMSDAEMMETPAGSVFVFDTECYRNFWFLAFKCVATGKVITFEKSPAMGLNVGKLQWMLWRFCFIGFNSRNYDLPMMQLAINGYTTEQLKGVNDEIILHEERIYNLEKKHKFKTPNLNHIDLIEVAPLQGSLKKYAARLHAPRLQDLPIDPNENITEEDAPFIRTYCCNDLELTLLLATELKDQLSLREKLTKEYGQDLRSKSDAQIAEAVINAEVKRITGFAPVRQEVEAGKVFKFMPPEYMCFQTPYMQRKFNELQAMDFEITETGKVVMETLKGFTIRIGDTVYTMGKGGLHSTEKIAAYQATDELEINDDDVESYYPRLMINSKLSPASMGDAFMEVFSKIVERRIHAKRTGDKVVADSLKITINGTFGKLGSRWSTLYAPHLLIQVTLGGQLSLLMLIEMLELNGFKVISANTDGIVSLVPKVRDAEHAHIMAAWCEVTGLKTEKTRYKALYSRDINNYIAVKEDNTCKFKGAFSNPWASPKEAIFRFHKNPTTTICIEAVAAMLTDNVPVQKTITECKDVCKFVAIQDVKGGAEKDGVALGKVVRWYYAKGQKGVISRVSSGHTVPKTEGAKPMMDLAPELPTDVDYDWYIESAVEMLYSIGFYRRMQTVPLFF